MTDRLMISGAGPVEADVTVPGSKSLTNRALLAAALAEGNSILTGALESEDTQIMAEALARIGFGLTSSTFSERIVVHGGLSRRTVANVDRTPLRIYVGNSGITARFLTAVLSFLPGVWELYGKERMYSRPIGDLLAALRSLGAEIDTLGAPNSFPLRIAGRPLSGGEVSVRGNISSQFLSALLMAAPLASGALVIGVEGELVSRPYIEMTLAVMKSFGVTVETPDAQTFVIPEHAAYRPTEYAIEPDASAASYFFALPAIVGGRVTVQGLSRTSLQGDVAFADLLEQMGCRVVWQPDSVTVARDTVGSKPTRLVGLDVDMSDISDTVQTLAVVSLFAATPTRIRNVAHIRGKETDRIAAAATELRKFGVQVDEYDDGLLIRPKPLTEMTGGRVATYDDHRMAMSFALAGLALPGVLIENAGCTAKTYPNFFDDLEKAVGHAVSREV
jgi:3-phosphoshikimate 1-carboxyvinyltransferase